MTEGRGAAPRPSSGRRPQSSTGLDSDVAWAVTLHVLAFPLMFVLLVVVAAVGSATGVRIGSDDDVGAQWLLRAAYAVLVLAPLLASLLLGRRAWLRRRRRGGLVVAALSGITAVGFLLVVAVAVV